MAGRLDLFAKKAAAEADRGAREQEADRLQSAADEAASLVRNLYIAFLSFGLYLTVTFGATTHEQLFRGAPVFRCAAANGSSARSE